MFGNMGMGEIALIMVVILLLFGAKRIPEIAGSFGKGIREFKKSVNDVDRSIRDDVRENRLEEPRGERLAANRDAAAAAPRADDADRPAPKRLLS
jgi:sec-independent protein translocase protein TatA